MLKLLILLSFCWMSSVANYLNEGIDIQDWITLSTEGHVGQSSLVNTRNISYGYIRHVSSGKYIHPSGGHCPPHDALLRLGERPDKSYLFRFVPVFGHLGYIEHYSGMLIHPYGGKVNSEYGIHLVLHPDRHSGAYFYIDYDESVIEHIGRQIFYPPGDRLNPTNGTHIFLHRHRNSWAKFRFVPAYREKSVMPPPKLTGSWKILFAANASETQHIYNINYKIGKVLTKQATEEVYWKVSAKTARSWFENSNIHTTAFIVFPETWNEAFGKTYHLKVDPGKKLVLWQWVFCAEQLDEEYCFRSPILANTDDATINPFPPNIYP